MVMLVKESRKISQLQGVSKTKIRGVLALLKHGEMLITHGNEGNPVRLYLAKGINSFKDLRERHDAFILKYMLEHHLFMPAILKSEIIWQVDDETKVMRLEAMNRLTYSLQMFFNELNSFSPKLSLEEDSYYEYSGNGQQQYNGSGGGAGQRPREPELGHDALYRRDAAEPARFPAPGGTNGNGSAAYLNRSAYGAREDYADWAASSRLPSNGGSIYPSSSRSGLSLQPGNVVYSTNTNNNSMDMGGNAGDSLYFNRSRYLGDGPVRAGGSLSAQAPVYQPSNSLYPSDRDLYARPGTRGYPNGGNGSNREGYAYPQSMGYSDSSIVGTNYYNKPDAINGVPSSNISRWMQSNLAGPGMTSDSPWYQESGDALDSLDNQSRGSGSYRERPSFYSTTTSSTGLEDKFRDLSLPSNDTTLPHAYLDRSSSNSNYLGSSSISTNANSGGGTPTLPAFLSMPNVHGPLHDEDQFHMGEFAEQGRDLDRDVGLESVLQDYDLSAHVGTGIGGLQGGVEAGDNFGLNVDPINNDSI
jgi:hypothetical protein